MLLGVDMILLTLENQICEQNIFAQNNQQKKDKK